MGLLQNSRVLQQPHVYIYVFIFCRDRKLLLCSVLLILRER